MTDALRSLLDSAALARSSWEMSSLVLDALEVVESDEMVARLERIVDDLTYSSDEALARSSRLLASPTY